MQALRDTRSARIADLVPDELQKVKGRVRGIAAPLVAPVSGRRCVYWCVLVEKQWLGLKLGRRVEWFREARGQRCMIEDDSGAAFLDIGAGEGDVSVALRDPVTLDSTATAFTPRSLNALVARALDPQPGVINGIFERRVWITEWCLVDQELVVGAHVRFQPDPGGRSSGPREVPSRAVLGPAGSAPLLAFDSALLRERATERS